jgi:hypothetical protein
MQGEELVQQPLTNRGPVAGGQAMNEAGHEYADLQHDAECWRTFRRLRAAADEAIEQPGANRLATCSQWLRDIHELIAADAKRELARAAAAVRVSGALSRAHLRHRVSSLVHVADESGKALNLIRAALGQGQEGQWPALFPPQIHPSNRPVDGNLAAQRDYLAALLEYANLLNFFGTLTEAAELIAKEANRGGGLAGRKIIGPNIVDWRQSLRSEANDRDSSDKNTYRATLEAFLREPEQPQTKEDAIELFRPLVGICQHVDPRRPGDKLLQNPA